MSVTGHVTPFVIQRGARINMYGSKDSSSAACGMGVGEKDSSEVTEWGATEVTLDLDRLMYPKKSNGRERIRSFKEGLVRELKRRNAWMKTKTSLQIQPKLPWTWTA